MDVRLSIEVRYILTQMDKNIEVDGRLLLEFKEEIFRK